MVMVNDELFEASMRGIRAERRAYIERIDRLIQLGNRHNEIDWYKKRVKRLNVAIVNLAKMAIEANQMEAVS